MLLDGDQLRHGLNGDLGFSPSDRAENVRRAGEVARLFFEAGHIVLCTFVSPFARDRDAVRSLFPPGRFTEIYVKASVSTLRARDVKGLYARESTLSGLTAYEPPEPADLTIDTDSWSIRDSHRVGDGAGEGALPQALAGARPVRSSAHGSAPSAAGLASSSSESAAKIGCNRTARILAALISISRPVNTTVLAEVQSPLAQSPRAQSNAVGPNCDRIGW